MRAKLKVLMITDVYFPRVNGVSTSIKTFRRVLAAQGVETTLIAPAYPQQAGSDEEAIRISSRRVPLDPEDRFMNYREVLSYSAELARRRFDLVHIQTPFVAHYAGTRLGHALGIPAVVSYHTFFEEYLFHYIKFLPRTGLRWLARRFSRAQCNDVNGIIVPSYAMLEVLRDYNIITRAAVIPTGIDIVQFQRGSGESFRRAQGIAPDRPVLLYLGRVVFEKNIEFLLRVIVELKQRVPDVCFVVAGEGPARESLARLAKRLGLEDNTLFVGNLDRGGAIQDCYRAANAFIFASRTETQGLVLLEAMAAGVPIVSTAVMGTKEVLSDGQGCVIAKEYIADFSDKVWSVLTDARLRQRLGETAPGYVAKWSQERFGSRLVDFYRETLDIHRGQRKPGAHKVHVDNRRHSVAVKREEQEIGTQH